VPDDLRTAERRWLALYLLLRAVAITVLGILLLLRPNDTLRSLARIAGSLLVLIGSIDLVVPVARGAISSVRGLIVLRGALTVGVGAMLLGLTDATISVIVTLLGMQLVVGGGVSLLLAMRLKGRVASAGLVVRGTLALGTGIAALVWPAPTVATVVMLYGLQWILSGLVSSVVAVDLAARPAR
jgi:uncharacterized membrane protein HdeD (DUF308 family)